MTHKFHAAERMRSIIYVLPTFNRCENLVSGQDERKNWGLASTQPHLKVFFFGVLHHRSRLPLSSDPSATQEHCVYAAVIDRGAFNRSRKYICAYKAHLIAATTGIDRLESMTRRLLYKVVCKRNSSLYEQPEAWFASAVCVCS